MALTNHVSRGYPPGRKDFMTLDYSTLGLISLVIAGLNSLLLVLAAVMWRHLPGPRWWALGGLAHAGTALAFVIPAGTLNPAVIVATMAFTCANVVCTHRGLVLFIGGREGLVAAPAIAGIALAAIGGLTWLDRPALRALVFLAAIGVIGGMMVHRLVRCRQGRSRLPSFLVAFVYEATVALLLYRWLTLAFGDALGVLAAPAIRDAITMGAAIILSNLRLFGLGLMVTTRLQEEANRHAEAMRRDARQDVLTGLANRRALFDAAGNVHAEWPVRGPYAAIMLDLDHFKVINDRFGHGGGDEALRIVAAFLAATARPQDIVARLGGEEFVIVLPACSTADAMAIAEALRLGMHRLTVVVAGRAVDLTASLGLAVVDDDDSDFAALLDRADQALYAAKTAGRDRIKLSPGGLLGQRHGRSLRRHGRPHGSDQTSMPMTVIDGTRHFNSGTLAGPRPADARHRN